LFSNGAGAKASVDIALNT